MGAVLLNRHNKGASACGSVLYLHKMLLAYILYKRYNESSTLSQVQTELSQIRDCIINIVQRDGWVESRIREAAGHQAVHGEISVVSVFRSCAAV